MFLQAVTTITLLTNISRISIITTTEFIYTVLLIIMWTIMIWITSIIAKIISKVLYVLNIGSGGTLPGYITLKLFPSILTKFSGKFKSIILITGTNGKTTTTKIITSILRDKGYKVISNSSGSNLERGIVTTLLNNTDFFGNLKGDIAVLEVDEFNLPITYSKLGANHIVLLNLSRDQLDRYGETDTILRKWVDMFNTTKPTSYYTTIHCYKDQREFMSLRTSISKKYPILYFESNSNMTSESKIHSLHNSINAAAAYSVLSNFNISLGEVRVSLNSMEHAYGRGEEVTYKQVGFQIYLAKNPSSYNNNLSHLITSAPNFDAIYFILNDKLPDGRDVSWIYDIDPKMLLKFIGKRSIYISGTRYLDMAIRLQYAGAFIDKLNININHEKILNKIIKSGYKSVVIFPNYSSMLEIRKILVGRSIL